MKDKGRQKLKTLFLRGVRGYTHNFPIEKGKYRIYEFAKRLCGQMPENLVTQTKDGRKFSIGFKDWSEDLIYFLGKYDPVCTDIIKSLVKKGNVCFDVGANFGWYTTLFSKLCGANGQVHSFEPVPEVFQLLQQNAALNNSPQNIFLNNFGLGNEEKILNMHIFEGQPSGHSSLAGRKDEKSLEIPVKINLLDNYLEKNRISRADFIKVDIEGAEMMFLRGAEKIFDFEKPPVILMEMVLNTSKNFGYLPNALIEFIGGKRKYEFYIINETDKILERFEYFADNDIGANVLCLPTERDDLKLEGINIK